MAVSGRNDQTTTISAQIGRGRRGGRSQVTTPRLLPRGPSDRQSDQDKPSWHIIGPWIPSRTLEKLGVKGIGVVPLKINNGIIQQSILNGTMEQSILVIPLYTSVQVLTRHGGYILQQ